MAFQKKRGLPLTGALNASSQGGFGHRALPAVTEYTVTTNDLARLLPVSKTSLEKCVGPRLDFENIVELLGDMWLPVRT